MQRCLRVSTRILFADDSVTAQNMGKRILTEAGYEVVAVSNGAAAVKKIAEQKPDIIILDLYMPGYSGLEVCEKVRGSMATLKTPVLLTVGKLEPYRPEDANRVRADGVIVKPFEASDLLAIVKKFEERIVPPPPPLAQQIVAEEDAAEIAELPLEASEPPASSSSQPMLDVPDHMASSAAFTDMLGMEPAELSPVTAPPSVTLESPMNSAPPRAGVPEYELPVSWKREEEIEKTEIELPAAATSEEEPPQHDVQVFETATARPDTSKQETTDVAPPPAPSRPLQIPVYQESAEVAASHEMLPTAAAPIGEIEIPRDPFLQESAAETTRNTPATATEPGLMSTLQEELEQPPRGELEAAEMAPLDSEFTITHSSREIAMDVPVDASPQPASAPVQAASAQYEKPVSDDDFEARVAAALASYNQAESVPPAAAAEFVAAAPAIEPEPSAAYKLEQSAAVSASPDMQAVSIAPSSLEPEPAVSAFEYHPPVRASFTERNSDEPLQVTPRTGSHFAVAHQPESVSAPEFATIETAPVPEISAEIAQSPVNAAIEAASQELASAAAAGTNTDRDTIAQAVSRAMERLKPELVNEIMREIKSKE